jgi:hypothetical protein
MSSDNSKRITDKWLSDVMTPNRHFREYYIDNDFIRLTIQTFSRGAPLARVDRTTVRVVKTRGDLRLLVRALDLRLRKPPKPARNKAPLAAEKKKP